jgi:hypothetical protein
MAIAEVLSGNEYKAARRPAATGAVRRRTPRQARAAVLSGLMIAAALQIGAAVTLNLWFPEMIDPHFGSRLASVWEGRAANPAHTFTVIMVGSSRTYFGLQTGPLSAALSEELGRPVSVVNAGSAGGGSLTELLFWRRLQRDGVRPDLLLIEVMPGCLNDCFPSAEMRVERLPANRIGWRDLPLLKRYQAGTRPTLRRDVAIAEANTLYSRRLGILLGLAPCLLPGTGATTNSLLESPGTASLPADPTPALRKKALDQARRQYAALATFSFTGRDRATDALHELLASCREAGVPTGLVLMPEGPEFRSWYAPGSWPKFQGRLRQIGREEGAKLIVAREWIDEDDFLDSHHLLPAGAQKFSDRLGRECLLPLIHRQEETAPRKGVLTRVVAP